MKEIIIFIITIVMAFSIPSCQAVPIPLWVAIVAPTTAGIGGAVVGFYCAPEKKIVNNMSNTYVDASTNVQIQTTYVTVRQETTAFSGSVSASFDDDKGHWTGAGISISGFTNIGFYRLSTNDAMFLTNLIMGEMMQYKSDDWNKYFEKKTSPKKRKGK